MERQCIVVHRMHGETGKTIHMWSLWETLRELGQEEELGISPLQRMRGQWVHHDAQGNLQMHHMQ